MPVSFTVNCRSYTSLSLLKEVTEIRISPFSVNFNPFDARFSNTCFNRTTSPIILEVDAKDKGIYENELFGPIVLVIKTKDTAQSVELAKEMVAKRIKMGVLSVSQSVQCTVFGSRAR